MHTLLLLLGTWWYHTPVYACTRVQDTTFNTLLSEFGFAINAYQSPTENYEAYQFLLGLNDRAVFKWPIASLQINTNINLALMSDTRTSGSRVVPMPTSNQAKLEAILAYRANWVVDPYISSSVSSPIIDVVDVSGVLLNAFADPLFVTLSSGLAFQILSKDEIASVRLGGSFNRYSAQRVFQQTDIPTTPEKESARNFVSGDMMFEYQNTRDSVLQYSLKSSLKVDVSLLERYTQTNLCEVRIRVLSAFGLINRIETTYDPYISKRLQYRVTVSVNIMLGPNF